MKKRRITFYKDYYISPDILSHAPTKPMRWTADHTNTRNPYKGYNRASIQQQYEALNLHFFKDKASFRKFFSKTSRSTTDIDRYWQEYLTRDALIASGEYSTIRAEKYSNTYINKLKEVISATGGNHQLRVLEKTLSNLDKTKLGDILAANTLPDLTRMYYGSIDEILPFDGEGSYDDILSLFKTLGVDIKEPDYHGLKGINYLEDDDAMEVISNAIESTKLKIRITSKGNAYIPFVPKRFQSKAVQTYWSYNRDAEDDYVRNKGKR